MKGIAHHSLRTGENGSSEQFSDQPKNTQHVGSEDKIQNSKPAGPDGQPYSPRRRELQVHSCRTYLVPMGPARSLPAEERERAKSHRPALSLPWGLGAGTETGRSWDLVLLPTDSSHPAGFSHQYRPHWASPVYTQVKPNLQKGLRGNRPHRLDTQEGLVTDTHGPRNPTRPGPSTAPRPHPEPGNHFLNRQTWPLRKLAERPPSYLR